MDGIFQQDSSYPGRDTAEGNIGGFFDRLGAPGGDIWSQIFRLQQGKDYNAPGARQGYLGEIQSKLGEARSLYDQVAGQASFTPTGFAGAFGPAASAAVRSSGKLATDTPSTADPRHGGIPGLPSGQGEDVVGWMESQVDAYNAANGTNLRISADYPGGPRGHPDDGGQHSVGHAVDIAGSPSEMAAFANYWTSQAQLVADTRQLIHNNPGFDPNRNIIGGRFTSGPGTYAGEWAEHADHIHLATQDIPGGIDVAPNAFSGAGMPSSPAATAGFGGFDSSLLSLFRGGFNLKSLFDNLPSYLIGL
jgi:hypothetical protein